MAYINGKEILFSPKVDITYGDGTFVPSGTIDITANGEHDVSQYAKANVLVDGTVPSGTINITENGEHDVSQYAKANVALTKGGSGTLTITGNGTYPVEEYASAKVEIAFEDAGPQMIDGTLVELKEEHLPVSAIRACAFYAHGSLKRVIIPSSVKSIGEYAFNGCPNLETVAIREGLETIGLRAFHYCTKLSSVKLPSTLQFIDAEAFRECTRLTYVNCTDCTSIPTLGQSGFFGSGSLTGINMQILVPAALYEDWKAATNWSNYASKIVAV